MTESEARQTAASKRKGPSPFTCPTCGAAPGRPCRRTTGRVGTMIRVHAARRACTCATPCVFKGNRCDYCGGFAP